MLTVLIATNQFTDVLRRARRGVRNVRLFGSVARGEGDRRLAYRYFDTHHAILASTVDRDLLEIPVSTARPPLATARRH